MLLCLLNQPHENEEKFVRSNVFRNELYICSTFDVGLLYSEFCDVLPLVAVSSVDGASVGIAEVDKCVLCVCGQCLDSCTL